MILTPLQFTHHDLGHYQHAANSILNRKSREIFQKLYAMIDEEKDAVQHAQHHALLFLMIHEFSPFRRVSTLQECIDRSQQRALMNIASHSNLETAWVKRRLADELMHTQRRIFSWKGPFHVQHIGAGEYKVDGWKAEKGAESPLSINIKVYKEGDLLKLVHTNSEGKEEARYILGEIERNSSSKDVLGILNAVGIDLPETISRGDILQKVVELFEDLENHYVPLIDQATPFAALIEVPETSPVEVLK